MKKKILIISVALMGFILALTSHSWAARESGGKRHQDRGGQFQKKDKPAVRQFDRDRARGFQTHPQHYRPAPRFKPNFHRRHLYRAPSRFNPTHRLWRHRPFYRHGHPGRSYRRPHRSALPQINNYYSSAESYSAPPDELTASATISDTGFSVSLGVRETN